MPYLNRITEQLGLQLKATAFSDKRFASAEYYGIAYPVLVDNRDGQNKMAPCVPQPSTGEYLQMMLNDNAAFVAYHKIINKVFQVLPDKANYGRFSGRNLTAQATMQMLLLYNRDIIKILPDELEAMLVTNWPDGSETRFTTISNQLTHVAIRPISSNFNYAALWDSEFRGYDFNVTPDRGILSVTYTIESAFRTGCFNLCDCNGEAGQ